MKSFTFGAMPLIGKIAVGMVLFHSWILFEELILDRHGLWKVLPFYKKGDPCVWDLGVFLFVTMGLIWYSGRTSR